jgi:hypothetical protein
MMVYFVYKISWKVQIAIDVVRTNPATSTLMSKFDYFRAEISLFQAPLT